MREAFRQYLESSREFLLAAEGFALKGWPDRKVALHNTFRLQQLFHDREALRFDHLTVGLGPEDVLWKSLSSMSSIFQRIDALWNDVEEDALKMANAAYADILAEIKESQVSMDSAALDGPLLALQRDPEYHSAREVARQILLKLDDEMAR